MYVTTRKIESSVSRTPYGAWIEVIYLQKWMQIMKHHTQHGCRDLSRQNRGPVIEFDNTVGYLEQRENQ